MSACLLGDGDTTYEYKENIEVVIQVLDQPLVVVISELVVAIPEGAYLAKFLTEIGRIVVLILRIAANWPRLLCHIRLCVGRCTSEVWKDKECVCVRWQPPAKRAPLTPISEPRPLQSAFSHERRHSHTQYSLTASYALKYLEEVCIDLKSFSNRPVSRYEAGARLCGLMEAEGEKSERHALLDSKFEPIASSIALKKFSVARATGGRLS